MIGKVTRTIFIQANPKIIELLRTPVSYSCFPLVFSGGYLRPKGCTKGDISQVHFNFHKYRCVPQVNWVATPCCSARRLVRVQAWYFPSVTANAWHQPHCPPGLWVDNVGCMPWLAKNEFAQKINSIILRKAACQGPRRQRGATEG
jgi:hypothetical protein